MRKQNNEMKFLGISLINLLYSVISLLFCILLIIILSIDFSKSYVPLIFIIIFFIGNIYIILLGMTKGNLVVLKINQYGIEEKRFNKKYIWLWEDINDCRLEKKSLLGLSLILDSNKNKPLILFTSINKKKIKIFKKFNTNKLLDLKLIEIEKQLIDKNLIKGNFRRGNNV
jgi:hypothetical protein